MSLFDGKSLLPLVQDVGIDSWSKPYISLVCHFNEDGSGSM